MRVCQLATWGVLTICLSLLQSAAFAADGRPSQETLDAMGLAGMRVMSDDDALAIRGQGAFAFGISFANVAGAGGQAGSTNGYVVHGKKVAKGENFSFAKIVKTIGKKKGGHGKKGGGYDGGHGGGHGGGKPMTWSLGAFAGGSSFGKL